MESNIPNPDEWLSGWDPTPGIVSIWADPYGRAIVWRRVQGQIIRETDRYQPFVFARTLADLGALRGDGAIGFQKLTGGGASDYRYLITAQNFRTLERTILPAAARRLGVEVSRLSQLEDYYTVGAVEQYLMQTGRTYFGGMAYSDLHRLQLAIATTSLDPKFGRIFMVALRDSQGWESRIVAPGPGGEAGLIRDLCRIIRERNPDVIEGHCLFGFDLPYLQARARALGLPLMLGRIEGKGRELVREDIGASHYHRAQVRYTVAGRELIDTLQALWRHDAAARSMPGYGLRVAGRYFGLSAARRTPIHGHHVYDRYQANGAKVRSYALDDVRIAAPAVGRTDWSLSSGPCCSFSCQRNSARSFGN